MYVSKKKQQKKKHLKCQARQRERKREKPSQDIIIFAFKAYFTFCHICNKVQWTGDKAQGIRQAHKGRVECVRVCVCAVQYARMYCLHSLVLPFSLCFGPVHLKRLNDMAKRHVRRCLSRHTRTHTHTERQ